jgi:hypothetical protein
MACSEFRVYAVFTRLKAELQTSRKRSCTRPQAHKSEIRDSAFVSRPSAAIEITVAERNEKKRKEEKQRQLT